MAHVDALSRIVTYIESIPLEQQLQFRQLQDSRLKGIAEDLEFTDNEKFELIDGLQVNLPLCDSPISLKLCTFVE